MQSPAQTDPGPAGVFLPLALGEKAIKKFQDVRTHHVESVAASDVQGGSVDDLASAEAPRDVLFLEDQERCLSPGPTRS